MSEDVYVYNLPWNVKQELCTALDFTDSWKHLAIHMKYNIIIIQEIDNEARRTGRSPTDILLDKWGQLNHTATVLFVLLARMKHYTGMKALQTVIPQKFHRLINNDHVQERRVDPTNMETLSSQNVPVHVKYLEKGIPIESSKKIQNGPALESDVSNESNASLPTAPDELLAECASALPMISYSELSIATNNWDESYVLGNGGYGIVYRGEWKFTAVAIKRLKSVTGKSEGVSAETLRELRYLNACRHDNVLPLYGYSIGGEEPCLVYQLMTGGSLADNLRRRNGQIPLSWKKRLAIAQGVAKGLQYLHTVSETPLIHGDIKPANILLDTCREPKIGDFGLAKEGPNAKDITHMQVSKVHGTLPYLPDEYLRHKKLSIKVDTYSFGIVLFELVTGEVAHSKKRAARYLKDHIIQNCREENSLYELQDSQLKDRNEFSPDLCKTLIMIGLKCVQNDPRERPTMVTTWQSLMTIIRQPSAYDEEFDKLLLKQI